MLCSSCHTEIPDGASSCGRCGTACGTTCTECATPLLEAARFCHECGAPRERASSVDPNGERRHMTVMFCDLVGSTPLSLRLDPEQLQEVMTAYQRLCAEVIQDLDGHVAQYLGDGLLVYFGFPHAHEDDPVRAIRAALAIHEALPLASARTATRVPELTRLPLQARIGVHTGHVVIGTVGGGSHRERLALGDTVNLAARLRELAAPGQVVISDTTRRLVRDVFQLEDLGPRDLRGLSAPVRLWRVTRSAQAASRLEWDDAGLTPFVGRQQELALLLDRWTQVNEGLGQSLLLQGEAGIGKSRLVRSFRERLPRGTYTWLEGRCSPYHRNSAFYPVVNLLEHGLGLADEREPSEKRAKLVLPVRNAGLPEAESVPLFASLLSLPRPEGEPELDLSPEARRRRTLELLVAWLTTLARRRPAVILFEDLHWIDPSTLELLDRMIEQAPTCRVLLLLTLRPGEESHWSDRADLAHLTLHPLTRQQMRQMAEGVAQPKALPAPIADQVVSRADGVPLFVEELTRNLLESDLVRELDDRYELTRERGVLAIPDTLQGSLTERLDRLGPVKEVAQLAAVLGREFSCELLSAVAEVPPEELERTLALLVDADLFSRRGVGRRAKYLFRHALIHDAAYRSLLKSRRQEHHARVARVLQDHFADRASAEPEIVAHHWDEAGHADEAIAWYQMAGERATRRQAHSEAIEHLSRGLALLEELPPGQEVQERELRLRVALGTPLAMMRGAGTPEVESTYARARELLEDIGDAPQLFGTLWGLSQFYFTRGEIDTSLELNRQILAMAERSGDDRQLVMAHLAAGAPHHYRGEPRLAMPALERSIALYDPERHGQLAHVYGQDPGVIAHAFAMLAQWSLGFPDRASRNCEKAIAIARETGHQISLATALAFGAILHHHSRRIDLVTSLADEAAVIAEKQHFPLYLGIARVMRGWARAHSGEPSRGRAEVEGGLAGLARAGQRLAGPTFLAMLAEVCHRDGSPEGALSAVDGGLALAASHGLHFWDADLLRLRGELLLERDAANEAAAEECYQQALADARARSLKSLELRAATSYARLLQKQGRAGHARAILSEIYDWFGEGFEMDDLRDARLLISQLA